MRWSEGETSTISSGAVAKQASAIAGAVFLPTGSNRNFEF